MTDSFTHGTRYGYTFAKCKCPECRAWNAERHRRYRARRREQGWN